MGKYGKIVISLLISAVSLFAVLHKINWQALGTSVSHLDLRFLAAAVAVFLTTFFVRTLRWKVLLDPAKRISYRRLFAVIFIGYMANNVLPARLGELVRAYVLGRKEGVRKTTTIATIFIERIFDGLSLLFILGSILVAHTMGWISMAHDFPASVKWASVFAGFAFVGAFGFVLALEFWPGLTQILTGLIRRFAPESVAHKLESILLAFAEGVSCLRSFKTLVFVFGASLLVWGIEGSTYALMGQAFHLTIPARAYFIAMVIVNLGTIIPSAPGFVGVFQFFCMISLAMFGVPKEVAVGYGLVLNVSEYLPVTLFGVMFLAVEGLRFNSVMNREGEGDAEIAAAPEPLPVGEGV
ncbi:MAG: putative rane protein [Cyanobacteria bacterium RYN_339]|nr:putative rane protein [Cyanobacteria bacterium RYN_339]